MDWREAQACDVDAIAAIAGRVHEAYPERREVFAERVALFPQGCLVLARGPEIAGYALSHPWRFGDAVPLDTLIDVLPHDATCLYLHDAAFLPQARGQGQARSLVARLETVARQMGLPRLCLTAVNGAAEVWRALGFRPADDPAVATKLASYGGGALYMARHVG